MGGSGGSGGPPGGGGSGGPGVPRRASTNPGRRRFINYPRQERDRWTRWIPSWKLITSIMGMGFLLAVGMFMWAYARTTIPTQDEATAQQTTIIYYADGKTEIGRLSEQNRVNVTLGRVPAPVQSAVLAAEDHTFYENSGVDPKSLIRAAWSNLRGNATQGGSTITQQYVKNFYDLRDRTIKRKAQEFFIALKINRTLSKTKILESYLNTIYMGRGAYGIQAATEAYFGSGKRVEDLTLSQGAFLAGLINAPSATDPYKPGGRERAERRWGVVLDAMVDDGTLDAATRAKQVFPIKDIKEVAERASLSGQRGYMIQMAQQAAADEMHLSLDAVATGGFKIVTTFNKRMVNLAAAAVKDQLGTVKGRPANIHAGAATIDPKTGALMAIYGGPDFIKQGFNNASMGGVQAGSTFKPFGLIAALEDGVSLKSRYDGSSPQTIGGQKVQNFGNQDEGYQTLVGATAQSVNTIYVALNNQVGPEKTQAAAWAAGIPKSANVDSNLVNVLGSANPTVIDMANAYATFADNGTHHSWYVLQSIGSVGGKNNSVFDHDKRKERFAGNQAFKSDPIKDLTYAMQQVVQHGSGSYARSLNREIAGKTGTSTDSLSAWFVGFTPSYATAVAMWQGDGTVSMKGFGGFRNITGGSFPVRIWTEYMRDVLQDKPKETFPAPVNDGKFYGTPAPTPVYTPPTSTAAPSVTPTTGTPTPTPTPTNTGIFPLPTTTFPKPGTTEEASPNNQQPNP